MNTNLQLLTEMSARPTLRLCSDPTQNEYRNTVSLPSNETDLDELPTWSFYPATEDGDFRCLAIDLDGEGALDEAHSLSEIFTDIDLPHILANSGRGYHIFITLDGLLQGQVVSEFRDRLIPFYPSIDPSCLTPTQTIRGVGSPHRLDSTRSFVMQCHRADERASYDDLRSLCMYFGWFDLDPTLAPIDVEMDKGFQWNKYNIKHYYKKKLEESVGSDGKCDRSSATFSTILKMCYEGMSDEEILFSLTKTSVGEKFRGRGIESLQREIEKARDTYDFSRGQIQLWYNGVEQLHQTLPRKRTSLLTLAESLAKIAMMAGGKLSFTASTRQIAEHSNLSTKTVTNSLNLLRSHGLLSSVEDQFSKGNPSKHYLEIRNLPKATTLRDHDKTPTLGHILGSGLVWEKRESGSKHPGMVENIWSQGNLGPVCRAVYAYLQEQQPSSTVKEITEALQNFNSRQVRNALNKLVEVGVLTKERSGRHHVYAMTDNPLPEAKPTREKLAAYHHKERELRKQYVQSVETYECIMAFFPKVDLPYTEDWMTQLMNSVSYVQWNHTREKIRRLAGTNNQEEEAF